MSSHFFSKPKVFGNVRHDSVKSDIGRHNNFSNFFYALLLLFRYFVHDCCFNLFVVPSLISFSTNNRMSLYLFRCATGESWQAVMLACRAGMECQLQGHQRHHAFESIITTSSNSSNNQTKNDAKCGSNFAYLYFCSFVFLSSFLVSQC